MKKPSKISAFLAVLFLCLFLVSACAPDENNLSQSDGTMANDANKNMLHESSETNAPNFNGDDSEKFGEMHIIG